MSIAKTDRLLTRRIPPLVPERRAIVAAVARKEKQGDSPTEAIHAKERRELPKRGRHGRSQKPFVAAGIVARSSRTTLGVASNRQIMLALRPGPVWRPAELQRQNVLYCTTEQRLPRYLNTARGMEQLGASTPSVAVAHVRNHRHMRGKSRPERGFCATH